MNGKEGITEFVRVRYNLPLQKDAEVFEKDTEVLKKDTEVLKKDTEVLKKDTELFKKHQGLFASFSTGCLFLNVHVGIGLHVYTYRSTHTYA
ncbi:hypothetical protein [Phocaeicola massiliensis]|uniref:hypothetical protein n=1 Tax=Phocaeicola massiliensis TaxID=204516 RepID=UPI0032EF265C